MALALGRTLAEVLDLSALELAVWAEFHNSYGFPHERAEWGRAMAGAYVGAVWGGKAKPAELIPKIPQRTRDRAKDHDSIKAWFEGRAAKKGVN